MNLYLKGMVSPLAGTIILLGLVLTLAPCQASLGSPLSPASAINKAGRQRMLSQRMVKIYCQIGMNLSTNKSKTLLESSSRLFETQLAELSQDASTPDIRDLLSREANVWSQFKSIINEPVSLDGAKKLMALNEGLLQAAEQLTKALEKNSHIQAAHLVNLSGRQRMLSQRIAKFYMLRQWGIKDPSIAAGVDQAKSEFVAALNELENSPLNTRQISNALIDAHIQWDHFIVALDEQQIQGTNTGSAIMAAFASEHLLEEMDKITSLYEESAAGN